jgi:hypothetical protein
VPTPTQSTFHPRRIEPADFHRPTPANALCRLLCFYRKSDAKAVDSARQPTSIARSYESRNAPKAPAPWFIARYPHRLEHLLQRNKAPSPRLSN